VGDLNSILHPRGIRCDRNKVCLRLVYLRNKKIVWLLFKFCITVGMCSGDADSDEKIWVMEGQLDMLMISQFTE